MGPFNLARKLYRKIFPLPVLEHYAKVSSEGGPGEGQFTCNVCGTHLLLPWENVTREGAHCPNCHSYSRLRSVVYALLDHLDPSQRILQRFSICPKPRGLGFSDSEVYGRHFRKAFEYQNTFYDREPKLDLLDVDWRRYPARSFDFLTCSDVLEHVPPPSERIFANLFRLLKPGGILILTVPTTLEEETVEHFPDLHDWTIEREAGKPVLSNRRKDGSVERREDLCFHGGDGLTLEMRIFSRKSLLALLAKAGFEVQKVYETSIREYGICLMNYNFVVVAGRPATG